MRALFVLLLAAGAAHADEKAQAQAVERALIAAEPALHRCWEKAAADDWHVEGRVDLTVKIAGKVKVTADGTGKQGLAACAADVFAHAAFGDAFAAGDSVEIPVTFKAEPNVTVRAEDVTPVKLGKNRATARVLIDGKSAAASQASLALVEVPVKYAMPELGFEGTALVVAIGQFRELVLTVPGAEASALRQGALPRGPRPPTYLDILKPVAEYPIAGGKGRARFLVDGASAFAGRLSLEAGVSVPEHAHAAEAEILYFLSGAGEMTVDGEKYTVEPGTAVHIPPGARHAFTATSPVDAVQFYAPAGPEQRFKGTAR